MTGPRKPAAPKATPTPKEVAEPKVEAEDAGTPTEVTENTPKVGAKSSVTHRLKPRDEWETGAKVWNTLVDYLSLVPIDSRSLDLDSLKIAVHNDGTADTRIDWKDLYGNANFVYTFKTPPAAVLKPVEAEATDGE